MTSVKHPETTESTWRVGFQPRQVLLAGIAGTITGILSVSLAISYSALIFMGPLEPYLPVGVGNTLVGAIIIAVAFALFSSLPGILADPQETPAAAMAAVASAIAGIMVIEGAGSGSGQASPEILITVMAAMGLSSILTGLIFFLVGQLKIGDFARFLPVTVLNGFLVGLGWLIVVGAIGVMAGISVGLITLTELFRPQTLMLWLPGFLYGALAMLLLLRWRHFLLLPALLLLGVVGFYTLLSLQQYSIDEARQMGLLFARWPGQALWRPIDYAELQSVDWGIVVRQMPGLIVVTVVSLLGILFNASALELALDHDIDLNQELRSGGIANTLAGLTGGLVGYPSVSKSLLAHEMGVHSRLLGFVSAGICAAALFLDPNILTLFPKPILGGLLVYLGLTILRRSLFQHGLFSRMDYAIILVIALTMVIFGLLQGIAVGLIAAFVLFVLNYSRIDVVKHRATGSSYHSRVSRPAEQRRIIQEQGHAIYIAHLHGYIFFGTANQLYRTIRARIQDESLPVLRFVLLDFRQVTGVDSTALVSFEKLLRLMRNKGLILVFTSLPSGLEQNLTQSRLDGEHRHMRIFLDADLGLAWCEEQLLQAVGGQAVGIREDLPTHLGKLLPKPDDVAYMVPYFERLEVGKDYCLIKQGDPADELYFAETGTMSVWLELPGQERMRLNTIRPGQVVGEIGFLLEEPRTATVMTNEAAIVHRLTRARLAALEEEAPAVASAFHKGMLHLVAGQLADTTVAYQNAVAST